MTDTTPSPGQIWQDNDPRSYGRKIRIVEIGDTHAVVQQVAWDAGTHIAVPLPGVRRTHIRLDQFRPTSTGYRYIGHETT